MIYLFYGEDTFSLHREVKNLRAKFSSIDELEFSSGLVDSSLRSRVQELLEGQGLFSQNRLVIFRDLVNQIHKHPQTEAFLEEALPKLDSKTTVVFYETEGGPDKRLRFFKKLQKVAKPKEFISPEGKSLEAWIRNWLEDEGFEIESEASAEFLTRLGTEYTLWQVETELQKLLLSSYESKVITADTVRKVVGRNVNQNIFDLTNLVAEGQISRALRLLEEMVSQAVAAEIKPQVIQIVGALASQLRSLLLVKELEGREAQEIAKILSWKEGRVWINLRLAKKFEKQKLIRLMRDLKAIDFRLKTSEEPPKLFLTLFFQKAATR